ncbi:PaaI family thioesterase [Streptomyces sp. NBC_00878]|uniref:PaaI family thioesterase n=1 Tax=Streptomyces sp. NBC_00878 TaxID=2975854 RepID=UPI00224EFDD7|nr:PaaI family thioesterase [Streptomyces sp. NBC_00878]MCX4904086.1 PaaI family thioesterase [Streptomyces sp. NBC_00878]
MTNEDALAPDAKATGPAPDPALDALLAAVPFAVELGIELEAAGPEFAGAVLPWSPRLCTVGGVLHGGALMALADTAGAVCAFFNLPAGAGTSTVESKTNFFRAVRSGHVRAEARPLHTGRSFIVIQTDLYDAEGKRVGQTTQTQAVLGTG